MTYYKCKDINFQPFIPPTRPLPQSITIKPQIKGATVNQLLRRAALLRRERNNSNHSDDLSLKRNRMDNGILGNNNNLDAINHMPQITATDFSTHLKHNNNTILPHIKDTDRHETKTPNGKLQLHSLYFFSSFNVGG